MVNYSNTTPCKDHRSEIMFSEQNTGSSIFDDLDSYDRLFKTEENQKEISIDIDLQNLQTPVDTKPFETICPTINSHQEPVGPSSGSSEYKELTYLKKITLSTNLVSLKNHMLVTAMYNDQSLSPHYWECLPEGIEFHPPEILDESHINEAMEDLKRQLRHNYNIKFDRYDNILDDSNEEFEEIKSEPVVQKTEEYIEKDPVKIAHELYDEIGSLLTKQEEVRLSVGKDTCIYINWNDYPLIYNLAGKNKRTLPETLTKKKSEELKNFLKLIKLDLRNFNPGIYKEYSKLSISNKVERERDSGSWFDKLVSSDKFISLKKYPKRQLVLLDLTERIENLKIVNPDILTSGFKHSFSNCRIPIDPEEFRRTMKELVVKELNWLLVKYQSTHGNIYTIDKYPF